MSENKQKTDIKSMNVTELKTFVTEVLGEPGYRATQLYSWLHIKLADSFEAMSNLPAVMKAKLNAECQLTRLEIAKKYESAIDGTCKYLLRLPDGHVIESVLMLYKHGHSICVSSQVGCRMGCRFCASTLDGLTRQLSAAEMLEEVYVIQKDCGERISNVVIMGSGEPLDNYDQVVRFIRILTDDHGLNISQRNITLSTCGIVPRIYDLAEEDLQMTLALSLHAVTDERRRELMPIANKYSIKDNLKALKAYYQKTNRRLTIEYSLVQGVNDSEADAAALALLLKGMNVHINLIPVNPIKERDFRQSEMSSVVKFKNKLEKYGENVTIRREMGRDIQAACGQLRKNYIETLEREEIDESIW